MLFFVDLAVNNWRNSSFNSSFKKQLSLVLWPVSVFRPSFAFKINTFSSRLLLLFWLSAFLYRHKRHSSKFHSARPHISYFDYLRFRPRKHTDLPVLWSAIPFFYRNYPIFRGNWRIFQSNRFNSFLDFSCNFGSRCAIIYIEISSIRKKELKKCFPLSLMVTTKVK